MFLDGFVAMLSAMSSSRRMLVLLLGVFLALGMSLAAVQAGETSGNMTQTFGIGAPGHCNDCGDSGIAKKMTICSFGCVAPALAVIPQTTPARVLQAQSSLLPQDSLLFGRAFSPDPLPPRSGDHG